MSRLIDADAFWKHFEEGKAKLLLLKSMLPMKAIDVTLKIYAEIKEMIDSMPTIDPEPHWIPFHKRPLTEEEQKEHKDWCWILDCELPDDNQEVLISSPYFGVYIDTFYNDGECSFDGGEEINDGMAWMPLPEPYREVEE